MKRLFLLSLAFVISGVGNAHHSTTVAYDFNNIGTIEGDVTSVFWVNPHVLITLERIDENGEIEVWETEAGSQNSLERIGIGPDIVKVGDHVGLTGALSRQGLTSMAAVILSLPDGTEVPLWPQRAARLGRDVRPAPISSAAAQTSARAAEGIFRVWSRIGLGFGEELPFTAEALAAQEAWAPLTDDPALKCIPPGMPTMMNNPYPIEFTDNGDSITLRLEEWDGLRTIHMASDTNPASQPTSPVGYSVGRWEGETLVVTTTRISDPFFDDEGTPQSEAAELVERFTVSEDEQMLGYNLTVTDPLTFTEPAVLYWRYEWVPGEEIKPFNCALPDA